MSHQGQTVLISIYQCMTDTLPKKKKNHLGLSSRKEGGKMCGAHRKLAEYLWFLTMRQHTIKIWRSSATWLSKLRLHYWSGQQPNKKSL